MPADQEDQNEGTETVEEIQANTAGMYALIALILGGAFLWDKYRGKY